MSTPNDGWIEWSGGECPVELSEQVEVRLRDGEELHPDEAGEWDWAHRPRLSPDRDIIAYRVVKP